MKSKADICWAIEWCTICKDNDELNPCYNVEVPDYIPNEQILRYINGV